MCRAVRCKTCTKTTWSGCGRHVDHVMAGVPHADRCPGHPEAEKTGKKSFGRLFGRG